jgi:hypothetical protein
MHVQLLALAYHCPQSELVQPNRRMQVLLTRGQERQQLAQQLCTMAGDAMHLCRGHPLQLLHDRGMLARVRCRARAAGLRRSVDALPPERRQQASPVIKAR